MTVIRLVKSKNPTPISALDEDTFDISLQLQLFDWEVGFGIDNVVFTLTKVFISFIDDVNDDDSFTSLTDDEVTSLTYVANDIKQI